MNSMVVQLSTDGEGNFDGFELEWDVWGEDACKLGTHKCTTSEVCVDRQERGSEFAGSKTVPEQNEYCAPKNFFVSIPNPGQERDGYDCICSDNAFRNATGHCEEVASNRCETEDVKCPALSKCKNIAIDRYECECSPIHFIGWEGRQKKPKVKIISVSRRLHF